MASPGTQSPPGPAPPTATLAERVDVHKSCKAVEVLLGIFNEYCEAVGALNALQKRLAKALRETAGVRGTGEIAVNAMSTSATIFEVLAEVDAKFAKIADKEYDSVSTEVKKWFKKLAKEERNHDEKMANANTKIKQAGQNYEKKSKKKAMDVGEEHIRYINLISTLGPEMAQEKYNHALNVTQRHSSTIQNVAACLSRLADSEWQKSCECVRRFSPTVGSLGQWKAMCEGGWTGPVPSDLPIGIEAGLPTDERTSSGGLKPIQEEKASGSAQRTPETRELELPRPNPPGYSTGPPSASASAQDLHREHMPSRASPTPLLTRQTQVILPPAEPSPLTIAQRTVDLPVPAQVDPNTGSVRSLSAFPSPPTHFPIPPARQTQPSSLSQTMTSSSNLQFPSSTAIADSPVSAHSDLDSSFRTANQHFRDSNSSHSPTMQATRPRGYSRVSDEDLGYISSAAAVHSSAPANHIRRPVPVKAHTSLPMESVPRRDHLERTGSHFSHRPSSSADMTSTRHHRLRYDEENREFGIIDARGDGPSGKAKSMDPKSPRSLERTDTAGSTGSLVAAMRNRYSHTSGSTSPPPRELPRIPLSVNDLASRYEAAEPLSPRIRAASPPVTRQQSLPVIDTGLRGPKDAPLERVSPSVRTEEERRYHTAQQDAHKVMEKELHARERELERRTKEHELQAREQDLEMRTRELERERARLQSMRDVNVDPFAAVRPRERRTSLRHQLQRPLSQMELSDGPAGAQSDPNARQKAYGAGAGTQLAPPPPLSPVKPLAASPKRVQHSPLPSPRLAHSPAPLSAASTGHASNCGCETCSVSKYAGVGVQQQQTQHQRVDSKPDKPRSWMRRLSMPVGTAFGLDSAKRNSNQNQASNGGLPGGGTTNFSLGAGVGNTSMGGRGLFSLDGKKNASTTALSSRTGDVSDGRAGPGGGHARAGGLLPGKKSHDTGGVSNRSMTNLSIAGRH